MHSGAGKGSVRIARASRTARVPGVSAHRDIEGLRASAWSGSRRVSADPDRLAGHGIEEQGDPGSARVGLPSDVPDRPRSGSRISAQARWRLDASGCPELQRIRASRDVHAELAIDPVHGCSGGRQGLLGCDTKGSQLRLELDDVVDWLGAYNDQCRVACEDCRGDGCDPDENPTRSARLVARGRWRRDLQGKDPRIEWLAPNVLNLSPLIECSLRPRSVVPWIRYWSGGSRLEVVPRGMPSSSSSGGLIHE